MIGSWHVWVARRRLTPFPNHPLHPIQIQLKQKVDRDAVLYQLLSHVTVLITAALYLVGHIYYKEPNPSSSSSGSSPASSPSKPADGGASGAGGKGFASFFFKSAATAAAKDPEGAFKVAGAVAPSAAQLMFGGFGGGSSATLGRENTAVKGFYDEETAPAEPAAPYRPPEIDAKKADTSPKSGAIFGAGSSKAAKYSLGSSAEDVPEAVRLNFSYGEPAATVTATLSPPPAHTPKPTQTCTESIHVISAISQPPRNRRMKILTPTRVRPS